MFDLSGLELLNTVADEHIAASADIEKKKRPALIKYVLPAAAALAVLIAAVLIIKPFGSRPGGDQQALLPPETFGPSAVPSVTAAPQTVTPEPTPTPEPEPDRFFDRESYLQSPHGMHDSVGDGIPYFIYHGKAYISLTYDLAYCEFSMPELYSLIGPSVAWIHEVNLRSYGDSQSEQSTFLPEESGELDPFAELSGSFTGTVYELKGYDPEKVLCTVSEWGVSVFFTGSGAVTGGDIFEGVFNMRSRIAEFYYNGFVRGSGGAYYDTRLVDPDSVVVSDFLDALDSAEWVALDSAEWAGYDAAQAKADVVFNLHIRLSDGLRIEISVLGDGRVYFAASSCSVMLLPESGALGRLVEAFCSGEGEPALLPEHDINAQVNACRVIEGFGECIPAFIPEGYHYSAISVFPIRNGAGIPVGTESIGLICRPDDEHRMGTIAVSIVERSSYEADPRTIWTPDSVYGEEVTAVPLAEFTAADIHSSKFMKGGAEYELAGAIIYGDYVVVATSDYIIDSEIGSQAELNALIEAMYRILASVGQN